MRGCDQVPHGLGHGYPAVLSHIQLQTPLLQWQILNYAPRCLSEVGIQVGQNLRKVFSWAGRRGRWWQWRFPPHLTLIPVLLFALQGPATSAGPTTAQAGARRPPCSCVPGSPASRARSRSNTPTEPARARALPGSPRSAGQQQRTRNFQQLSLRSRTAGGPRVAGR